jgi:hypothetical protein
LVLKVIFLITTLTGTTKLDGQSRGHGRSVLVLLVASGRHQREEEGNRWRATIMAFSKSPRRASTDAGHR